MKKLLEVDDEKQGESEVDLELSKVEDDDDPDNSLQPRCCTPGHGCNISCVLKHYGAGGYSLENALLYTNSGYQFFVAEGVFDSTIFLIFAVIALVLITVCLTSANYPSNRNIVGRLLSRVACLSRYEQTAMVPTPRNPHTRSNLSVNAVFFAILRVLIPSISVYRITNAFLNSVFSLQSPVLVYIIVAIIAILSVPFALAFFDEGSNDYTTLDPDATFVEDTNIIAIPEDVELDHHQRFSLAVADPSLSRFENSLTHQALIIDNEPRVQVLSESDEHNEVPARRCGCAGGFCVSPKCIVQHLGSAGYSIQNAALNYDTAYRFCKSWGWIDAQTVLTGVGLALVTGSITVQNYFSAHTLLGNYLSKFFPSANASDPQSCFERCKESVGMVNGPPATISKVTIATVNFFAISTQLFFGSKPAAAVATAIISPAGFLATAGLFGIKAQAKKIKPIGEEQRIEELPEDYVGEVELDDTPVDRWSMRQESMDHFN